MATMVPSTMRGRFGRRLAALALAAAVTGCSAETSFYTPAQVQHKSTIEWAVYEHAVAFSERGTNVAPDQLQKLEKFLSVVAVGEGDQILVGPAGVPANPVATLLAKQREDAVRTVLRRGRQFAGELPASDGGATWDGSVTVRVGRWVLTPPKCPHWNVEPGADYDNRRNPNFGCATTANLDLHVANAGDLVRGREPGPTDAEGAAVYLRQWRKGLHEPVYRVYPPYVTWEREAFK